jgi:hypothetical protein
MRKLITITALAIAAVAAPRLRVEAQSNGKADSPPFLLAVAGQQLPRGERAVVIRTAHGAQMDLIVLAPDANAQHTLIGAITVLKQMREKSPTTPTTDVASISYSEAVVDIPAERRGRLEAALRQAKQGEGRKLAEFGDVHVVVVNPRNVQ